MKRRALVAATLAALLALAAPGPARANGWEHLAIPIDVLLRALEGDDVESRVRAAVSLGIKAKEQAVGPLLAALARPEPAPAARSAIYTALGKIGDTRALPALLEGLAGEDREELRGDAAAALGAIGDPTALPALLGALDRESFPVRIRLVDALGAFPEDDSIDALARLVEGNNQSLRRRAIGALGRNGADGAAAPLLAALANARSKRLRGDIVDALGIHGAPAAGAPLTELLAETDDAGLRLRIVAALGAVRDGSAAPTLIEMLGDGDSGVRYFAVTGLNRIAPPDAAGPLRGLYLATAKRLDRLATAGAMADPVASLRAFETLRAILRALLAIDAPTGLDAFLDGARPRPFPRDSSLGLQFGESVYELRRLAIVGLGYTDSDAAAAFVANGPLGDRDARLRAAAVRALGVLGRPGALDAIAPYLEDENGDVRSVATAVAGRLGDGRAVALLLRRFADSHPEVRRQAALGLGYLEARDVRDRVAALARDDANAKVREAARQTLHVLGAD